MDAAVPKNESFRDYQYYFYDARVIHARVRIELQVQDTSRYFLIAEAFIQITGTAYRIDDRVGFVNNDVN